MNLSASRKEALSADDAGRVKSKGSPSKPPKAVNPGRSDVKIRFPRMTDGLGVVAIDGELRRWRGESAAETASAEEDSERRRVSRGGTDIEAKEKKKPNQK